MRRRTYRPLFRATAHAAFALLVGFAASACGLAGTSPRPAPERAAVAPPPIPEFPYLKLRVGERRLYLVNDAAGTSVESFPIAVGRDGRETPTGRFQVEEMVVRPEFHKFDPTDRTRVIKTFPSGGATNPLGERWIGFAHGEGWTLGIHGTPNPELLGKAVSNGCVRMRNADVIKIYSRVQIGTPVIVEE
jgi:lipoprotein-anchoring transpeptidase ErfK/SrfK